jgi:hypothetical protein
MVNYCNQNGPRTLEIGMYALLKLQEHSHHVTAFAEGIIIKAFLDAHYSYSPEFVFFNVHQHFQVSHRAHSDFLMDKHVTRCFLRET